MELWPEATEVKQELVNARWSLLIVSLDIKVYNAIFFNSP